MIGIDYSMKCATACINVGGTVVYFIPEIFEPLKLPLNIVYYDNSSPFATASTLSKGFPDNNLIAIEGAAFGAKGRHSDIGEGLGRLMYALELKGSTFFRPSPKTIKKFATGSGNAKKIDMIQAWSKETGHDIVYRFHKRTNAMLGVDEGSPFSDIADAYWMMRYNMNESTKPKMLSESIPAGLKQKADKHPKDMTKFVETTKTAEKVTK